MALELPQRPANHFRSLCIAKPRPPGVVVRRVDGTGRVDFILQRTSLAPQHVVSRIDDAIVVVVAGDPDHSRIVQLEFRDRVINVWVCRTIWLRNHISIAVALTSLNVSENQPSVENWWISLRTVAVDESTPVALINSVPLNPLVSPLTG